VIKFAVAAFAASMMIGASASAAVLTYGAPGEVNSTNSGTLSVETFDGQTPGFGSTFSDTVGAVTFNYSGVDVRGTDAYGGAGNSTYAATYNGIFPGDGAGYALSVTSTNVINYFGLYVSASDSSNTLTFLKNGATIATYNMGAIRDAIGGTDQDNFFANFYFTQGETYDEVLFSQPASGHGFESDNHTVGTFAFPLTGTYVSGAVPEPATWGMMLVGFGAMGATMRRRRAITLAA
jgi:hypothetical protein